MTKPKSVDSLEQVAGNGLLHRRLFLQGGAGALAGATLLTARAAPPEVPASMKTPGTPMRAYGERSPHEARVQRTVGATTGAAGTGSSRTPLESLEGIITPSSLHFERHHNGVPDIDPGQHQVLIHGLVRSAADLQHGRARALPDGVAHPISRVRGQQRRQQQCRSAAANGRGHSRVGLVQRLDRRSARTSCSRKPASNPRASGCSPKAPTPRA